MGLDPCQLVVVDSLARSGTTLLSSVLHSQEGIACYRGVFHELKAALPRSFWPHGLMSKCHQIAEANVKLVDKSNRFRQIGAFLMGTLLVDEQRLFRETRDVIMRETQYDHFKLTDWESRLVPSHDSFQSLDCFYRELARELSVSTLCFRWNQGLAYAEKWLKRDEHYWITIIRHPMDRACSVQKTHGWTWKQSLIATVQYMDLIHELMGKDKLKLLYYEDLVSNPDKEMGDILAFLGRTGQSPNLSNLIGQDGAAYRVESADTVDVCGTHKVGQDFKGFTLSSMQRFIAEMPAGEIRKFENALKDYPLMQRYLG